MQNFCVLQFIAYSIWLGSVETEASPAPSSRQSPADSKGPGHITEDFISFTCSAPHSTFPLFPILFTTKLWGIYSDTCPNKWLNV